MTLQVLNLYAGIGGNRKLWDNVTDIEVTAVEWDSDKAEVYRDYFPEDTVIETDAHEYLLEHMDGFDFIWTSPPCPTHSMVKYGPKCGRVNNLEYPDMDLYEEIILLDHFHKGDYVVENVTPYYDPLIEPQKFSQHYWWSNFHIPETGHSFRGHYSEISELEEMKGFDLSGYGLSKDKKRKMLRNAIKPKLGKHILEAATTDRQQTLF